MNNKCLVTQLKASCTEMKNPIYFGKAEMLVEATGDTTLSFLHVNNRPVEVELIEGNSEGFSINGLGTKTYLSKEGNKIIINRTKEEAISDSNDEWYPLSFKTGIYKLRYDKYYFAPYAGAYLVSTLINTEDIIYREEGLYQKFIEDINIGTGFTGKLSNLLKVTPNDTQYFSLSSRIEGKTYSVSGNLQEILNKLTSLEKLSLDFQLMLEGNINDFSTYAGRSNIKEIYLGNCKNLTGDIVTAFANCTSLTKLTVENLNQVKGAISELAQAQVNNGRTSGTLAIVGYAPQIVPNPGSIPSAKTITFTSSGYTIS